MSEEETDYLLLAQPRLQAGDVAGAIEMIDKAIAADESDHQAWRMKGLILESLGRKDEASVALAKAEELDSDGIDTRLGEAATLAMGGDHEGATAIYEGLVNEDPSLYEAWCALATSRLELGRKTEALEAAREAFDRGDGEPQLNYTLGRCLRLCGHDDQAIFAFDQALETAPDHALSIYEKGMCLVELKDLDQALACFKAVLALIPGDAGATAAVASLEDAIQKRDSEDTSAS